MRPTPARCLRRPRAAARLRAGYGACSWTCSSTRRGTSSPRTASRCCPAAWPRRPRRRRRSPREIGQTVVVKAQVKTGGRGKAGGVKLADNPEDAKARAQDILGLDIKGHIVHQVMVAQASDIAEEYYFSYLLDRANRTFLAMASVEGGMDIEEVAVDQARGAGQGSRSTPARASTRPRPPRSSTPAKFPAEVARPGRRDRRPAVGGLRRRGRHAGRGQPAGARRPTARSSRSTARSPSTRTPTSATRSTTRSRTPPPPTRSRPRPRRRTSTTSSSTARSASSATAPAWS